MVFCQFCNKLQYLITQVFIVKFPVTVVVVYAANSLVNKDEYNTLYTSGFVDDVTSAHDSQQAWATRMGRYVQSDLPGGKVCYRRLSCM